MPKCTVGRPWLLLLVAACGRLGFGSDDDGAPNDAATEGATRGPNRVFMTSTTYTANFGGIATADAACQDHADTAGLDGSFIALLGDDVIKPLDRVAGARGWVDVAGWPIVDDPATWLTGGMFHPMHRDERGLVGSAQAWFGAGLSTCASWTSVDVALNGGVVSSRQSWFAFLVQTCSVSASLVCVETASTVPVAPAITQGRYIFQTTTMWTPGGGLAAADAVCQSEAMTAGLPGTYLALLATSTADGFARMAMSGAPWTRVDGIAVAATAADLAGPLPAVLDSFTILDATGTPHPTQGNVWVGSATDNCSDWTSSAATRTGEQGDPRSVSRSSWSGWGTRTCNLANPLLCLQQ